MERFKFKNDERSTIPLPLISPYPPTLDNGDDGGPQSPNIQNWGFEMLQQSKRLLFATRTDKKSISQLCPLFLEKVIKQYGEVNEMVRCRDGSMVIETKNTTQAEKLQRINAIGDCEIKISLSTAQNTCKAIVHDKDMIYWDKDKLLESLAGQGVTAIHNVKSRPGSTNDKTSSTPSFIVTFNRPTPPQHLKVGWLKIATREYVPEPIRCFLCQRYGHFSTSCKSLAVCSRCSEPGHCPETCKNGYKCINCGGSHSAAWKGCPVYKEEREIRRIGYRLKIPLPVAKKIYKSYVEKMVSMAQLVQNPSPQQFGENPCRETQEDCRESDGWTTDSSDDTDCEITDAQVHQSSHDLSSLRSESGEPTMDWNQSVVTTTTPDCIRGLKKSRKKTEIPAQQKHKSNTKKALRSLNRDDIKEVFTEQTPTDVEMTSSTPVPKNLKGNSKIS